MKFYITNHVIDGVNSSFLVKVGLPTVNASFMAFLLRFEWPITTPYLAKIYYTGDNFSGRKLTSLPRKTLLHVLASLKVGFFQWRLLIRGRRPRVVDGKLASAKGWGVEELRSFGRL